jgi:hypothetical protein
MSRLTDEQLAAIAERTEKATPGPWVVSGLRKDDTAQVYAPSMGPCRVVVPIAETESKNAPFIAAARTDIPALLGHLAAVIEEATVEHLAVIKQRDAALAKLAAVEAERQSSCDTWRERHRVLAQQFGEAIEQRDEARAALVDALDAIDDAICNGLDVAEVAAKYEAVVTGWGGANRGE